MKYNKLPIKIPEQVEKLMGRGLKFDSETKALFYYQSVYLVDPACVGLRNLQLREAAKR